MKTETPTFEFRQVKRPIKTDNGIMGPGWQEWTTGYDTTIEQKWVSTDMNDGQATYKEIWKPIPTVYA